MAADFVEPEPVADSQLRGLLSLLIPAYEHPSGVMRILDCLHAAQAGRIDCVIGDDSQSDLVEAAVLGHPLYLAGGVRYYRNQPTLGAIANWNELMTRAQGEYLLFMHHDECPEHPVFFQRLKTALVENNHPDVLLLNCLLPVQGGRRLRQHVPLLMRRALIAWAPTHLLLHNTLGSPSVVVLHRNRTVSFNPALKWLVDVDWAVRILRTPGMRISFSPDLAVISWPHQNSITATLKGETQRLRLVEAELIRAHSKPSFVFRLIQPRNWIERTLSRVERVAWNLLRGMMRAAGWVSRRRIRPWPRAIS